MVNLKIFTILFLLLTASLGLGACKPDSPAAINEPISITDGRGKIVRLEAPAQRVISLAASNVEILYAISAMTQTIGRDSFSDFPVEAQQLPDIGGGFSELNIELILSLKPDLVLAAEITPPEQIQQLEDLGLSVFMLGNPKDFDGLFSNLQTVARLTGREKEAAALVDQLKSRVAAVEGKIAHAGEIPLVFYELDATDPNAPFTAGPGTFVDYLIQKAGGTNLGASMQGEWVQISVEELLKSSPQIIILGDFTWGGVTPEQIAARSGWGTLAAVQNGKVFTFDDNLVSRPGPRLVDGLEAMAKLLHPELFK